MLLYDINDEIGIKKCLDENGVVGILNVLDPIEIKKTLDDVELLIKKEINNDSFNLNDPYTYNLADSYLNNFGVIGKIPLFTEQLLKNRFNKKVRKAYSIAYGIKPDDLIPQHDRIAWMRPTIGPNFENWSKYKTPWSKPGKKK